MKINRILISICMVVIAITCSKSAYAQSGVACMYNPEMPVLSQEFTIEVATINDKMNYHDGLPLTEATGRVFIPPTFYKHDGRSLGMFIVCPFQGVGHYFAFEVRCPKCHYRDNKKGHFVFIDWISAKCNRCGTRADHLTWYGIGQCQQQDGDELLEIYYLDQYLTESYKKNGKWYVKVSNNPIITDKPRGLLTEPSEPFRYPGT